ncbi:MAG: SMP-30/gluconolactonase/LRE family protein, partial [Algoriphagus sp.]
MAVLFMGTQVIAQEIEDKRGIVAKNAELVKVQDGFEFTEGPAVNRFGDVFFTDQPNNRIHKWNAISNEVSVFKEDAGRANGMYFMLDGTLVAAADNKNELWAFDTDGNHSVWITAF